MELYNYKAVIEYDGTDFFGFQSQPGEIRTVQGESVSYTHLDVYKRQGMELSSIYFHMLLFPPDTTGIA